jgi:hypothetical protein
MQRKHCSRAPACREEALHAHTAGKTIELMSARLLVTGNAGSPERGTSSGDKDLILFIMNKSHMARETFDCN